MSIRSPLSILAAVPILAIAALAAPAPARSQTPPPQAAAAPPPPQDQITGVISAPGLTRLALAIPAFRLAALTTGSMRDASAEIQKTLVSDLEYTGYFDVLPAERYAGIPDDPASIPYAQWAATGAVALLLGSVTPDQERLTFEGYLYDTRGRSTILGKRYRGETSAARQIAHLLSNEIVMHFTGRRGIALSRFAFEGRVGKGKEIFMMDYDGFGLRQVTQNGSLNLAPVMSPDGKRLAFVSYRSGSPRLYILSEDSSMVDVSPKGADLCAAPDWSADGKQIAFSAARGGDSDIFVYDTAGGTLRQVTFSPASDTSPTWSPSGREIAFTSDRTGRPQIYVIDAEGANVRRLTFDGPYNDQASWSPQGDRIAFAGWVGDHFDIFVIDPATGASQKLTEGSGYNENPRWSADGRHLVFTSNRVGIYQIYTMDDNGGRQMRLRTPFETFGPDWSR